MKHELNARSDCFKETWPGQYEVFSWMEFVTAIPQAISVITTWKEGRIPNACLQAWTTYVGDGGGYYVIFSIMNNNHTYKNILRDKEFAMNFPSSNEFWKCSKTVENNADDTDEITCVGLTVEPAQLVDAPRIKECFLNLECRLSWERPLHDGSLWHIFAGEVVHVAADSEYVKAKSNRRYGEKGYIYNVHSPIDPSTGEQEVSKVGKIEPMFDMW
jgi:flavin reductase (DIM6/NTAB) family NADH-FMN oxidoreductase RutF